MSEVTVILQPRKRSNPLVFLSSALGGGPVIQAGFRSERERIYAYGEQYGHNAVWVDEYSEPNRAGDPFDAIDDFLYELERSTLYLALIATDWPGTGILVGGQKANATFFETELFYAAVVGRPIAVVVRTDIPIPSDTSNLLALLQRVLPKVAWHPVTSAHDAEEAAKRLIDGAAAGRFETGDPGRGDFGRLLHRWWEWREPHDNVPGLRWLDGRFLAAQDTPKDSIVEECLRLVTNVDSERQRLSRLWIALRELMGVPHDRTNDEHWLTLWNKVLTEWTKAAAWYGLHGHLELGYMAALYSLDDIRVSGHRVNPQLVHDPDWDHPYASLGSAYYAAAHRVASGRYRRLGLRKALDFVDRANAPDALTRSNILAIRGSVLQKLRAYSASVDTYDEVLRLRQSAHASDGSVGEAKTELGFGLLFTLRWGKGLKLLREGIALMEASTYRPGFVIRGKRKLAVALCLTGNIREARRQRDEADELAARSSVGRAI